MSLYCWKEKHTIVQFYCCRTVPWVHRLCLMTENECVYIPSFLWSRMFTILVPHWIESRAYMVIERNKGFQWFCSIISPSSQDGPAVGKQHIQQVAFCEKAGVQKTWSNRRVLQMLLLVSSSNILMVQGRKHVSMKCLKSLIHFSWTTYMCLNWHVLGILVCSIW